MHARGFMCHEFVMRDAFEMSSGMNLKSLAGEPAVSTQRTCLES